MGSLENRLERVPNDSGRVGELQMSAPQQAKGAPITDRRQLIEFLESGCKPKPEWRIGTEHEKFGYTHDDLRPLPYEGERGIRALLEGPDLLVMESLAAGLGPTKRARAARFAEVYQARRPGGTLVHFDAYGRER